MKIKNIRLEEQGDFISLAAECKVRHIGTDIIYFKFEKKYRDFIVADASPFAAALLLPSMKMGQDLVIEGAVSKKLLEGMETIIKTVSAWNLGLRPIRILASEVKADEPLAKGENASFFSGGVDSFYTYLKHKEEGSAINYLLLAYGFDINLNNPGLWEDTCKTVDAIAESEGVGVIKVESNIRNLIEPALVWDYTHGGCLAAIGLALRGGLKNIYIPSSLAIGQLLPWGSHPDLDPHWSTERVSFFHDGADMRRVDKVKYIADNPLALKYLRVCYINMKGKFNCGICDKCIRTMTNLLIAGKLEQAETFPHKIKPGMIAGLTVSGEQNAILHRENLSELEKSGIEKGLQDELRKILYEYEHPTFDIRKTLKKMRYQLMEAINQIRQLDFFYNQDRLQKAKNRLIKKLRG
jgi:hypothetical protein